MPAGYLEMTALLGSACLVLTDSGGLQKEAYWAKTPCITLRTETEWTETVDCGWNVVIGEEVGELKSFVKQVGDLPEWQPLYGDGHAAERIVASLLS
jgi:UDP-N-acetylglucosamine 2-epimerase